jgi:hypothetical protein
VRRVHVVRVRVLDVIKDWIKNLVLSAETSSSSKKPYEDFLIAEYNNIAQAHFNTVTSISEFFKHYIVIASLPISVAVIFLKPEELKKAGVVEFFFNHPLIPAVSLTVVAVLGFCVLGYVINLRLDALLYARTITSISEFFKHYINGIRKYFSECSGLTLEQDIRFRVLPKSAYFPRYIEYPYFCFVVLTFAIVGTGYFFAGWYFYWVASKWDIGLGFWLLILQ